MSTVPIQVLCSRNTTPWSFGRILAEEIGLEPPRGNLNLHMLEEDVRGQLTSRIALHYLLPELTKVETESILRHALGEKVAAARLMI